MIAHCGLSHIESKEATGEANGREARVHGAAARFAGSRRRPLPSIATFCHSPTVSDRPGKIAETADIGRPVTLSGQYRTSGALPRGLGIAPSPQGAGAAR
ncbi:hypothetical protein GCM10010402_12800 [Actinomadura luteofluorescens]